MVGGAQWTLHADRASRGCDAQAVHIALAYPVVLFPCLRALDSFEATLAGPAVPCAQGVRGSPNSVPMGSVLDEGHRRKGLLPTWCRNLVLVLATATLAVFLPKVQVSSVVWCACGVRVDVLKWREG